MFPVIYSVSIVYEQPLYVLYVVRGLVSTLRVS